MTAILCAAALLIAAAVLLAIRYGHHRAVERYARSLRPAEPPQPHVPLVAPELPIPRVRGRHKMLELLGRDAPPIEWETAAALGEQDAEFHALVEGLRDPVWEQHLDLARVFARWDADLDAWRRRMLVLTGSLDGVR